MVFRPISGRLAAGLAMSGFVFAIAGCQSAGTVMGSAAQEQTEKVKASDLRAYCPKVTLREGTAYFNTYARGGQDDPAKLVYQAAITDVTRDCSRTDGILNMNVAVAGKVVPGPLGAAGSITMPIRVAVVQGDKVLYSQLHQYKLQIADTSAATQFVFKDSNVSLPIPPDGTYQVYAGYDEGPPKAAAKPAPKVSKPKKKKPAPVAAAPAEAPAPSTSLSDIPR